MVGGNSTIPISNQFQAYIYSKDPIWFSRDSAKNTYKFRILVINQGFITVIEKQGTSSNVAPFGGFVTPSSSPNPLMGWTDGGIQLI